MIQQQFSLYNYYKHTDIIMSLLSRLLFFFLISYVGESRKGFEVKISELDFQWVSQ